jgi:transcription initiation factor TFIID subunit 5
MNDANNRDRTARLWSTNKVAPLRIFAGHMLAVYVARFHPNCNYVATGSAYVCYHITHFIGPLPP